METVDFNGQEGTIMGYKATFGTKVHQCRPTQWIRIALNELL